MTHPERRHTDPLLKELIRKVEGFTEEMKPIREFMSQVNASKKAAITVVSIFAAMGAAVTWFLNLRDHIHKVP